MGRVVVNSTALGILLSITFAFAVFLSRTMFDEARADIRGTQAELKQHEQTDAEVVGDLRMKNAVTMHQLSAMDAKVEEVRRDVKELLKRN